MGTTRWHRTVLALINWPDHVQRLFALNPTERQERKTKLVLVVAPILIAALPSLAILAIIAILRMIGQPVRQLAWDSWAVLMISGALAAIYVLRF
jgi:hypothetical protein